MTPVGSFSAGLPEIFPEAWTNAISHPFVHAVGEGSLPPERFHVWVQQDRRFVEGLTGVVGKLIGIASPHDAAGLRSGMAALSDELELFRAYAVREHIGLDVSALAICDDYIRFLLHCAERSYAHGLTAYYACERAYLEAWSAVRERTGGQGRYREWIANWTSDLFRTYVDWLGDRLDAAVVTLRDDVLEDLRTTFHDTVDFEVRFWTACWTEA